MTAKAALLALADDFDARARSSRAVVRDDASVVWEMAAQLARDCAATVAQPQLEGAAAQGDGGEAEHVSFDPGALPAEAITADIASLLSVAMAAYEPQATASMSSTPRSLLSVLLEAARRAVEAAAPAIRAAERKRIALAIRYTCACGSCKTGIADLLEQP